MLITGPLNLCMCAVLTAALTFGNKRTCAAEGGVLAGGGVTAQQRLGFVGEEALAVLRRVLHCQARRLRRFIMAGADTLAYIH